MSEIIEIKGVSLVGFHGCLSVESYVGATFFVDLKIQFDAKNAMKTDNLTETVDYVTVLKLLRQEFEQPSKLIENVAFRIGNRIKSELKIIESVTVTIHKPNAPVNEQFKNISFSVVC